MECAAARTSRLGWANAVRRFLSLICTRGKVSNLTSFENASCDLMHVSGLQLSTGGGRRRRSSLPLSPLHACLFLLFLLFDILDLLASRWARSAITFCSVGSFGHSAHWLQLRFPHSGEEHKCRTRIADNAGPTYAPSHVSLLKLIFLTAGNFMLASTRSGRRRALTQQGRWPPASSGGGSVAAVTTNWISTSSIFCSGLKRVRRRHRMESSQKAHAASPRAASSSGQVKYSNRIWIGRSGKLGSSGAAGAAIAVLPTAPAAELVRDVTEPMLLRCGGLGKRRAGGW